MSKVYMRAESNCVGITVEDDGVNVVVRSSVPGNAMLLNDDMALAVVYGLLRRMLENDGAEKTTGFVHRIVRDWMHHGVVRGGQ